MHSPRIYYDTLAVAVTFDLQTKHIFRHTTLYRENVFTKSGDCLAIRLTLTVTTRFVSELCDASNFVKKTSEDTKTLRAKQNVYRESSTGETWSTTARHVRSVETGRVFVQRI